MGPRIVSKGDPAEIERRASAALAEFVGALASRHKPVRIVAKRDVWHQRAAARALWVITLGGQRTYLTQYVTTLGHTIYVPEGWDSRSASSRLSTLRHELVHVEQFERWGWPLMVLVYGLLPLPLGLAYGRARLEWQAYAETLRAVAELEGLDAARSPELHAHIVARFVGPDYGWMWPFPRAVQRWIDAELEAIAQGSTAGGHVAERKRRETS